MHNPPMPPAGMPAYQPPVPGQPVASGLAMKRRHPLAVWPGLPLITLGIYTFVWYFKIQEEMGEFDRRRKVNPVLSVLAITLGSIVVIPLFVSVWNTGKRIAESQRVAGLPTTCSSALGLLLGLFGLYPLYYQIELNKIVDHYGQVAPRTHVPLVA